HFDLDYCGSPAIAVMPKMQGADADVSVKVFVTGTSKGDELEYIILDDGQEIARQTTGADTTAVSLTIENVHLWNGRKDPHLYTAHVLLKRAGKTVDERSTRFGCRSFVIDPEKG
ncbi:hypothetical protein VPJ68_04250, partial [Parabacteroides distasonis]